jgi:hypothetical protein
MTRKQPAPSVKYTDSLFSDAPRQPRRWPPDCILELLGPFRSSVLKILWFDHHPFRLGICPDLTTVAPATVGDL